MRKWLVSLLLLSACSESPLVTGEKADANKVYLTQISKGMTMQQVYDLMGDPYAKEVMSSNDNYYDVWYYITDKTELGQERITRHNLTPLVFYEGILQGWGNRYFKAVKSGQIDQSPLSTNVPPSYVQPSTPSAQTNPPSTTPQGSPTNPSTQKQSPSQNPATPQNPQTPQNPAVPQKNPPPNPPPYKSNPPKKYIPPSF